MLAVLTSYIKCLIKITFVQTICLSVCDRVCENQPSILFISSTVLPCTCPVYAYGYITRNVAYILTPLCHVVPCIATIAMQLLFFIVHSCYN